MAPQSRIRFGNLTGHTEERRDGTGKSRDIILINCFGGVVVSLQTANEQQRHSGHVEDTIFTSSAAAAAPVEE